MRKFCGSASLPKIRGLVPALNRKFCEGRMFKELEKINKRPRPFEVYTAGELWTDEHTSQEMLKFHLDGETDISSRREEFIERSAEWIALRFDVREGMRIADFGCGPGLYTTRLAKAGADVTGIDFSERSIGYARKAAGVEGLKINYVAQDYLEFGTEERFHLALMIMCDFCALSPAQRKKMLEKFHSVLEPGGCVLLDVYSLEAFRERKETAEYGPDLLGGFWSPKRYYGFLNVFKYEAEKVVLDKYTIVEADRVRVIYNWLQYFSVEAIGKEFEECGFSVENLYSDVAGAVFLPGSKEFAVVARKI